MALQQSLRNLNQAYKNHANNPSHFGRPRFKSKHSSKQSYRTLYFKIVNGSHIRLPKVGDVKMRLSRPIEGHPTSATIKKTPSGDYYVTIVCKDVLQVPLPKAKTEIVGVDAGVKAIATCSNGMVLENNHVLKRNEKKLRREQRRLSRKQKGSKNREKQRVRLAKAHEKVANARYDRTQKFTTALIRDSQAIAVEDLNIEGMKKNHRLAKAVSDACMGELVRELEYKSEWYGRDFVKVDRWFPSSKTCNHCGFYYEGLRLSDRSWVCPRCGSVLDRDVNASWNIRDRGLWALKHGTVGNTGTEEDLKKTS